MQLHYVATTYRRSVRSRTVRKESRLSSRAAAHRSIRSRSARRWGRCSLLFRFSPDVGQPCRFALAAVVGCCCAGERSGTVPASSSVVWPAYGAVRARDVGRDRIGLMYGTLPDSRIRGSGVLVRLHINIRKPSRARRRGTAATLLLCTTLTPYCSAQRNDCAYAMNPASDVDGRMVCSWLLYHCLDMLTPCSICSLDAHTLTVQHSRSDGTWHSQRHHAQQTVQHREGGWEAHRRDAEGSHGRGYNGTA